MTSQALLDLEWVLTSPSLMSDPRAVGPVEFSPNFADVEHLEGFVADRHEHRVGRYFEHLLHYWLVHVRGVELVEAGRQLIDDQRRTVGELDFLFRDESGKLCHLEASVKFFLHHPNADGSHFPGPAARDNFERKATKLFDSQLELGRKHFPEIQELHGFVRGFVFYQMSGTRPSELPARMDDGHRRGRWVRAGDVDQIEQLGDGFHVVAKPTWLAPVANPECLSFGTFVDQLDSHFEGPAYPVMVSVRDAQHVEVERCFVVPDVWPTA